MYEDDEVGKYRKKSNKNPPKKSKHKHHYESCVFGYYAKKFTKERGFENQYETSIGTYCPVCGKIGNTYDCDNEKYFVKSSLVHRDFTEEGKRELDKNTRTLPYFWIKEGWFVKSVDLDTEGIEII